MGATRLRQSNDGLKNFEPNPGAFGMQNRPDSLNNGQKADYDYAQQVKEAEHEKYFETPSDEPIQKSPSKIAKIFTSLLSPLIPAKKTENFFQPTGDNLFLQFAAQDERESRLKSDLNALNQIDNTKIKPDEVSFIRETISEATQISPEAVVENDINLVMDTVDKISAVLHPGQILDDAKTAEIARNVDINFMQQLVEVASGNVTEQRSNEKESKANLGNTAGVMQELINVSISCKERKTDNVSSAKMIQEKMREVTMNSEGKIDPQKALTLILALEIIESQPHSVELAVTRPLFKIDLKKLKQEAYSDAMLEIKASEIALSPNEMNSIKERYFEDAKKTYESQAVKKSDKSFYVAGFTALDVLDAMCMEQNDGMGLKATKKLNMLAEEDADNVLSIVTEPMNAEKNISYQNTISTIANLLGANEEDVKSELSEIPQEDLKGIFTTLAYQLRYIEKSNDKAAIKKGFKILPSVASIVASVGLQTENALAASKKGSTSLPQSTETLSNTISSVVLITGLVYGLRWWGGRGEKYLRDSKYERIPLDVPRKKRLFGKIPLGKEYYETRRISVRLADLLGFYDELTDSANPKNMFPLTGKYFFGRHGIYNPSATIGQAEQVMIQSKKLSNLKASLKIDSDLSDRVTNDVLPEIKIGNEVALNAKIDSSIAEVQRTINKLSTIPHLLPDEKLKLDRSTQYVQLMQVFKAKLPASLDSTNLTEAIGNQKTILGTFQDYFAVTNTKITRTTEDIQAIKSAGEFTTLPIHVAAAFFYGATGVVTLNLAGFSVNSLMSKFFPPDARLPLPKKAANWFATKASPFTYAAFGGIANILGLGVDFHLLDHKSKDGFFHIQMLSDNYLSAFLNQSEALVTAKEQITEWQNANNVKLPKGDKNDNPGASDGTNDFPDDINN